MCPVFFCADFWDGRGEGVSDAVGGLGCGVRIWEWRPDLESAVEDFFNFWRFCSTLEPARGGFGVGGRRFFQFLENLFYFEARAGRIWMRE